MQQIMFSPVNAFIEGRQARQQQDYANTRNALAQQELADAPKLAAHRNKMMELETRGAQMKIDQATAQQGYTRLARALSTPDPKAYVLQHEPELVAELAKSGADFASFDPEQARAALEGFANLYAGQAGIAPAGQESFTLKPGEARYVGGKVVAERAPRPGAEDSGFTLSPGQTRYGPDGKPIASVAPRATPVETFDITTKLRNEYNAQSKEFRGVADSFQRIQDSASDPSAAGDLALIFNYMKVLDPGSTVREGEFATAQEAGSIPSRIVAQYNRVLRGERLAQEQRNDILSRAEKLYKGQEQRHINTTVRRYEALAKRNGVAVDDVIVDLNAASPGAPPPGGAPMEAAQTQGAVAPSPQQNGPVKVNSPQEAMALPPGTVFMTPDGRLKKR